MSKSLLEVDPAVVAEKRPVTTKKLILGLDLGTTCGYSYGFYVPGQPASPTCIDKNFVGNWDLSAGPYDSGAIRFLRLRYFLSAVRPNAVFYEDVKFTPPGINKFNAHAILARTATSSEFIGALRATVCTWAHENDVPCTGFGIGTIKRRATARGRADKEDIIRACNEMFGTTLDPDGYQTTGVDNIADSAFVCLLGLEQYAAGFSTT
jgi:hypothetical protein